VRKNGALYPHVAGDQARDLGCDPVALQVPFHVGAGDLAALVALASHDDDFERFCARQERHGVADRARGRAAAVPADLHAIERKRLRLDAGNDDDRTPGPEKRSLDQELLRRPLFAMRLTDDGDVETSRDASEQVGGAGDAGVKQPRLRSNTGGPDRGLETGDRRLAGLGVLLALHFDQVGGNAAQKTAGDHRLIDKCDTYDIGAERLGDRNRVVRRGIAGFATPEVDDHILDHFGLLELPRRLAEVARSAWQDNRRRDSAKAGVVETSVAKTPTRQRRQRRSVSDVRLSAPAGPSACRPCHRTA
jgi:hypothetical protein